MFYSLYYLLNLSDLLKLKNAGCIRTNNFEVKDFLTIFLLLDSPTYIGQGFLVLLPWSLASLWFLIAII